jgi:DNA-binding HxlR family transcriptional regulator
VFTVLSQSTEMLVGGEEAMRSSKREVSDCPVNAAMQVIAGRWKGTILWRLRDGPKRIVELKRSIPGISERSLILKIQELVADGIIQRDAKNGHSVYYSLSSYGGTLSPVIDLISRWGCAHLKRQSARG